MASAEMMWVKNMWAMDNDEDETCYPFMFGLSDLWLYVAVRAGIMHFEWEQERGHGRSMKASPVNSY